MCMVWRVTGTWPQIYICVCMYVYMYANIRTVSHSCYNDECRSIICICIYVYLHIYICIYTYISMYMYISIFIYIFVCIYIAVCWRCTTREWCDSIYVTLQHDSRHITTLHNAPQTCAHWQARTRCLKQYVLYITTRYNTHYYTEKRTVHVCTPSKWGHRASKRWSLDRLYITARWIHITTLPVDKQHSETRFLYTLHHMYTTHHVHSKLLHSNLLHYKPRVTTPSNVPHNTHTHTLSKRGLSPHPAWSGPP